MEKYIIKQVKSYVDNNLNTTNKNVIGPIKYNFNQPKSFKEILDELEISNSYYYRALSISKH